MSLKLDKLALDLFDSPVQFGKAMELMAASAAEMANAESFADYEDFLMGLDALDEHLLSKAENLNKQINSQYSELEKQIKALQLAIEKISGGGEVVPSEVIDAVKNVINPPLPDEQNPKLSDLVKEWGKAGGYSDTYTKALDLFCGFLDDISSGMRVNELDAKHIRRYQAFYSKIPKGTSTSKYSISELAGLQGPTKAPKTIQDHYGYIVTFLTWLEGKAYPVDGKLTRVLTKGNDVKVSEKTSKKRVPFSDDDLQRLFNSDCYTKTGDFKTSAMYWCALVALFTGARMSEILQLETHDIEEQDEVWVVKFDDLNHRSSDPSKRLKQSGSRRVVPIHSQLIALGFVEFVKGKSGSIFDDEHRNKKGKYDAFQKRHTTYRNRVGVARNHDMEYRDFHSFRHTVRTRLSELKSTGKPEQRFDDSVIDGIVGHESRERSEGEKTYNHSQQIAAKKRALERLDYSSIDFDLILDWKRCEFYRKPRRARVQQRLRSKKDVK